MKLFFLILNFLAVALVVRWCLRKRRFRLLDLAWAFIGGYFINYCIRPALFLIDPGLGSAYGGMFGDDKILHGFSAAILFAMLGFAGFALGNLAMPKTSQRLSRALPSFDWVQILQSKPLPWIALLFLACGWLGLRSFLSETGWVGSIFLLLQGGQRGDISKSTFGHGAFTFATQLSLVGWALICAYWIKTPLPRCTMSRAARRLTQVVWFLLTAAIWAAFGERSSLMAVLFVPIGLRYTLHHRISSSETTTIAAPLRKLVIMVIVLAFLVGGPLGLLFKGMENTTATVVSLSISAWDSFEFTVLAQDDLRTRDLHWGSTYLQDIGYSWFPRSIFPWKPARYGIVVLQDQLAPELLDNEGATFPPGMLVEAFGNFGYIGLFLIPIFIGLFSQALYLRIYQDDAYWIVLLSFLFSTFASFRGFGGFLALLLANGFILWLTSFLVRGLEWVRSCVSEVEGFPVSSAHGL